MFCFLFEFTKKMTSVSPLRMNLTTLMCDLAVMVFGIFTPSSSILFRNASSTGADAPLVTTLEKYIRADKLEVAQKLAARYDYFK